MPAIYHEGSWLGNATDPEVLVKDTVGWTGKNRAYSQTNNAVIAHIENGITYDVSWTGSATVTLKKNSSSGATITSGNTSPLSFTADADYELYFGSSATVTNIMVKDSRITDPTYEPYHESVEEYAFPASAQGVLGAKNLLPYPYADTTKTEQGITFTDNGDGTVTIGAGTATGNAYFAFANASKNIKLNKGQYVISGGVSNDILFQFQLSSSDVVDTGNGSYFSLDSDYTFVSGKATYIRVKSGTVISSPVTIKPMLRLASDPDDTYQPYAMTNRELTEDVLSMNTGLLPQLMFSDRYGGTADKAINIDTINKPYGYMININTGSYFSGAAPTDVGNSFMLIGFSSIVAGGVEYGAQLAFGWGSNKIGIRKAGYSAQGTTWGAWQYFSIS